jgi:hypothetical protein
VSLPKWLALPLSTLHVDFQIAFYCMNILPIKFAAFLFLRVLAGGAAIWFVIAAALIVQSERAQALAATEMRRR